MKALKRGIMSLALIGLMLAAAGCPPNEESTNTAGSSVQIIRVRLLAGVGSVNLSANGHPYLSIGDDPLRRELVFPAGTAVVFSRSASGWQIGGASIGGGVLKLYPPADGALAVNGSSYRGNLRLVPAGDGPLFDVVNDVQIDDYLKGVLARELYADWHIQAYMAQAVVARTYALYHSHTEGLGRYWDVWPDERSQVYGGISAETAKSRAAAADTAGLVLTYGPGEGKIFEAFFSSDCGGVTQSAADAFGTPTIPPLEAHSEADCDKLSPHANWGPITIPRAELARRVRLWASRHGRANEADMPAIANVEVAALNPFDRPTRFRITDAAGTAHVISAEDMRMCFNTEAPPGNTLPSSFCKVEVSAERDQVIFYDGHGLGHGVGMCQYCAQQRALEGRNYEQILMEAYPQAKFAKAY